jgi:hypothetical protein
MTRAELFELLATLNHDVLVDERNGYITVLIEFDEATDDEI